ncbi:MAG: hypothetical protein PHH26_06790 [Candidatus Thermoplasmatota archaeon]|nr:hypothetical protein [Candidatus Thermoplasmatota archaeon]
MAGFLDRLPPKTPKGMRRLKVLFYITLTLWIVGPSMWGYMRIEPYKCAYLNHDIATSHNLEFKRETRFQQSGMSDVTTESYEYTGGTWGMVIVYTYSYPLFKGLYSNEAMNMMRRGFMNGLGDYTTVDNASMKEEPIQIGKYDGVMTSVDFYQSAYTQPDTGYNIKGKFMAVSLSLYDAKTLGATIAFISCQVQVESTLIVGGVSMGSVGQTSNPNAVSDIMSAIQEGFLTKPAPPL